MKTASLILVTACLSGFVFSGLGCVSIQLGGQKLHRAEGLSFKAPSSPFEAVQVEDVDQTWHFSDEQTSISFLTECGEVRRLKLEQVEQALLRDLSESQVLSSLTLPYQGVTARHIQISGQLDGQATFYQARIFIKKDCLYLISHVAPWKVQERIPPKELQRQAASLKIPGQEHYESFIKDFVVP